MENISLLGFFDSLTEDNLTEFSENSKFNLHSDMWKTKLKKKTEKKHTFMMSTQKGGGKGSS